MCAPAQPPKTKGLRTCVLLRGKARKGTGHGFEGTLHVETEAKSGKRPKDDFCGGEERVGRYKLSVFTKTKS